MLAGDKESFLTIYRDNYKLLFRYGFSLCADKELVKDCIQELFLEIWNTRPTLNKDVQNIQSYLCTWLRRKISRHISRTIKERSIVLKDNTDNAEISYEDLLIAFQQTEEEKEKLKKALARLTKKQLEIIRLKFFEGLSYIDIAAKTSLTPRTVYNLIYEAIHNLRKYMSLFMYLG
jgi:RNA polymerase sigma factor (sigma-70 family)